MDSKQRQLVNKYLDLFYRRKIFIVTLLLLSLPAGLGGYIITPKVYQASSLLSYQQQNISSRKMSRDATAKIRDIVSTLTQIVTSRTNLEKLIVSLDLYADSREKMLMEDVVERMRGKIEIKPSSRGDIFRITFMYSNPGKVVKVTNALAAKFIEENLKYREERAAETFSYARDELLMAKEVMDRKDSAMRDYKIRYYNEMPEQRITNVNRLISLQTQNQSKQESIQDFERTLVLIADQINNRGKILKDERTFYLMPGEEKIRDSSSKIMSVRRQLEIKKRLLENMLTRYTERHPEVKRTRKLIAKLEKEVEKNGRLSAEKGTDGYLQRNLSGEKDKSSVDKITFQLELQRKNVLLSIENIKVEKQRLNQTIVQYEKWVTAAPVREAEWSALTREYGQLKRHYEYLITQDLEAKSMLNLERRQKGSQFKVVDSARYPEKPIKPDFLKIMAMAIALGLGVGCGGSLLFDFFDTTFRDPDVLDSVVGVPLIATIPYIETNEEKRGRKRRYILAVGILIIVLGAIAMLFAVVWSKGYIVI